MDLIRRIEDGQGEFLLFALTPPRLATDRDRAQEIADTTVARLQPLELDGLILYDIDDETERNPAERPFPFMPTLDPADYLADHLGTWAKPVIVYRAVGKYTPEDLRSWLSAELYPDVVDGLEDEGGVPSRLMKTDAGVGRQEGTPWWMFAGFPVGRTTRSWSRLMSSLGRVLVA